MTQTIHIQEVIHSPDARIDDQLGVISGVKVLGRQSKNGRTYSEQALAAAQALYEDVAVHIDHPQAQQIHSPRRWADRFGQLKNVRLKDDGLYADLHYLKSHPLAEMTIEAARRFPQSLGLSHNADGKVADDGQTAVVEEIVKVRSVDLVGEPATTQGLFEGNQGPAPPPDDELVRRVHRLQAELDARSLLEEASLPALSPLLSALASLPSDDDRKSLVEAIATVASIGGPRSAPRRPAACDVPAGAEAFARAVRARR